jgi:hypothetical protein
MKFHLIPLSLAVGVLGLLNACKKAEQTAAPIQTDGATARNPVVLKVKWPIGNRYVYRLDLDQRSTNKIPQMPQPFRQDTRMSLTYALSVLKATPDGGRELELEFLANALESSMGGQPSMSFNSNDSTNQDGLNPLAGPLRRMVGSKLHLMVNADAKVANVAGLDEWRDNLFLEEAGPPGQMLAQQFNQGFFHLLTDSGRSLTAKPVSVGETWPYKVEIPTGAAGKISVDSKITMKGWENRAEHQCAILDSRGTLTGTPSDQVGPLGRMRIDHGNLTAKSWFDPELGALVDYNADQTMTIKAQMPGQPPANRGPGFTSDIGQKITLKLVELEKARS